MGVNRNMYIAAQDEFVQRSPKPKISLADIARIIDVPVVVATFSDIGSVRNQSTFGLDMGTNWAEFTATVDALCVKGSTIIPNIAGHDALRPLADDLIKRDIRFLAGLQLLDFDGWRVGSIAVLASQKHVARQGIALRRLADLGREFAGIGQ